MLNVVEKINGRTTIDVSLKPEAFHIEEVVAVGYGAAKKADITGAVASVIGDYSRSPRICILLIVK